MPATTLTADQFIARVYDAGVTPAPVVKKYGDEVSPHLHIGTDFLWSPDTHEYSQIPECIALFEEVRVNQWKNPIAVDAGYRTHAHELELQKIGLKTAKYVSPHSVGTADDYKVVPGTYDGKVTQGNIALRAAFMKGASALGLPKPRVGHSAYGEAFIHVDLMFFIFAPFSKLLHPRDWVDLSPELRQLFAITLVPGWQW
jgi:hypothetical protein